MGLMILGVACPIFFFSPVIEAQKPFLLNHLNYVGLVQPGIANTVDPNVVGQIQSHPATERAIPVRPLPLSVSIPPVSQSMAFVYGVFEDDLPYLVDLMGLQIKEGRLPRPRSNELVLSEPLAQNRDLHVGDVVGRPVNERDQEIPTEMVIVGILEPSSREMLSTEVGLGFASGEYLASHELYTSWPVHLFVVPAMGQKTELNRWLQETIASRWTLVDTYAQRAQDMDRTTRGILLLFAAVESIIAVVAAIALAALNYIFFSQRRDEFGILHSVGRSRPWLVLRTTKETTGVVLVAWLLGATLCVALLLYAQLAVFAPKGLNLNLLNLTPWMFTLPIPIAVVAASVATIAWMLSKLDPVAVVERR
jgi:hypothetical protein